MTDPSYRRLRRSVAIVACLVCTAALLTGSRAAGEDVTRHPLRVLQMNLCNSGIAGCYTGRSVTAAAEVIRAQQPDVVTLNEVCEDDVSALGETLMGVYRDEAVVWAFEAARDRRTASTFQCRNGQPYGVGLLAHIPAPYLGYATYGGIYPTQDPDDPEERAWLCIYAVAAFYACTTHLAYTSRTVALAQCRYLLDSAIPAVRARDGYEPTVLGGDLNLRNGESPDVESCLPAGYLREDDGEVQQVVATTDFTVRSSRLIGMDETTDHPSLLVVLTIAGEL
jgi:endonuclease/exonuclease/phosphatase family metal-dependent hydrolase